MHNWHIMTFLAVKTLPVKFTARKLSVNSGIFRIKTRKRLCILHMQMNNEEREKFI